MEVMKAALRTHAVASETGETPFSVRIEVGEHVFLGDEPAAVGGAGLGPNPFELLSAALAECTAMTIRWYARSQRWPVEHVHVVVDHQKKVLVGNPDIVDVFEKTITIRGANLSEEQVSHLLEVAAKCPIQRLLERTPKIITRSGAPINRISEW
jgi:putative redox protein